MAKDLKHAIRTIQRPFSGLDDQIVDQESNGYFIEPISNLTLCNSAPSVVNPLPGRTCRAGFNHRGHGGTQRYTEEEDQMAKDWACAFRAHPKLIDKPFDPIFKPQNVEVDQQTNRFPAQLQIGQNLGLMDRSDFCDRL